MHMCKHPPTRTVFTVSNFNFEQAPKPKPALPVVLNSDGTAEEEPTSSTFEKAADTSIRPQMNYQPVVHRQIAAPGWYAEPNNPGVLRYWSGTVWEDWRRPLIEAPTITQGQKSATAFILLGLFLGHLGVHNFYVGRTGVGVAQLLMYFFALATLLVFGLGVFVLLGLSIWVLVDLCGTNTHVNAAGLRSVRRL